MSLFSCTTPRSVLGGLEAGAVVGLMLYGAATAMADPTEPAPPPPNCTAADLAGVSGGVASATSGYLFAHPDVNNFFTGLKGEARGDIADQVRTYMDANPQVHADLQGIRQPLTDIQNRCGFNPGRLFEQEG